jgi:hypothetical protein
MRLLTTGNVGIGTSSPTSRLQVKGSGTTSATTAFRVEDANASGSMVVLDDGNVGIGTTSPSAKLDIKAQGALSTDIAFRVRNSADTFNIIKASGNGTVSIGIGAGNVDVGSNNNFFGGNAGRDTTTGINNNFIGFQAGRFNITGNNNSFFGPSAGFSNTTGGQNSFYGISAGYSNTTAGENTAVGINSGFSNTTGGNNSFFGNSAGRFLADGVTANSITTNSIFIGYNTKALANNQTNQTVIGHDATGLGSNTVVLGNDSILTTALKGNVGIGTTTPSQKLDVAGNIKLSNNSQLMWRNAANNADIPIIQLTSANDLNIGTTSSSIPSTIRLHTSNLERLLVDSTGNVGIGTSSPTARLQIKGSGTTSSTTALRVENANASASLAVRDDGAILIGTSNSAPFIAGSTGTSIFGPSQRALGFVWNGGEGNRPNPSFYFTSLTNTNWTTNTGEILTIGVNFNPTSGDGVLNTSVITPTINQTGGANGITRGLYVNPILTAAADFRAIENSVGNNLLNNTSGNTYIGLSTNTGTARLQVKGSGTTSATTTFLLQNSTPASLMQVLDNGQFTYSGPLLSLAASQSAFVISQSISQSAVVGAQVYGVNITPTFFATTASQTETAFRVNATFTGSAIPSSPNNIIADFGAVSAGSQLTVTDVTSGSIYMVSDVSGLPIIEATSDWTVNMYNYPNIVFQKTGSNVNISGSLNVSGSITTVSTASGQSSLGTGLIVNNNAGGTSISDFKVKTQIYDAINVIAGSNSLSLMSNVSGSLGFFGTTPTSQSSGWGVTNLSPSKSFDADTVTLAQLADVVGTLVTELKNKGLLG